MAEKLKVKFYAKEPSITTYLQFRTHHFLCINSNVRFKSERKVRGLEIRHKDLLGKPREEYISDLCQRYGDFLFHFKKQHEKYEKTHSEYFFWPTEYGGIELEYSQQKKYRGNNIEYACTVKFLDKNLYIKNIEYLTNHSDVEELKSPLAEPGVKFPVFDKNPFPEYYLTYDQVVKRFRVSLGDQYKESIDKLKVSPEYNAPRGENKSWHYMDFDKNYQVYFNGKMRSHIDKKIHSFAVLHSNNLGDRKKFLAMLKRLYGEYTHASLSKYRTYYSVTYMWLTDDLTAITYNYSTHKTDKPHTITFHDKYSYWNRLYSRYTYDLDSLIFYR